jgi:hypothetical protein
MNILQLRLRELCTTGIILINNHKVTLSPLINSSLKIGEQIKFNLPSHRKLPSLLVQLNKKKSNLQVINNSTKSISQHSFITYVSGYTDDNNDNNYNKFRLSLSMPLTTLSTTSLRDLKMKVLRTSDLPSLSADEISSSIDPLLAMYLNRCGEGTYVQFLSKRQKNTCNATVKYMVYNDSGNIIPVIYSIKQIPANTSIKCYYDPDNTEITVTFHFCTKLLLFLLLF